MNITITDPRQFRYKKITENYTFEYNNGKRQYVPALVEQQTYALLVDIQVPEKFNCPSTISGSVTYQGTTVFSNSTSTCQFVFKNKEEENDKLQLGREYRLSVNPPAEFVSSHVDFTFETASYQFEYTLEHEEIYVPPEEEEETKEEEETPVVPPENTKGTSLWIWIVVAVAGCAVVGGIITLIVCLVKRKHTKR